MNFRSCLGCAGVVLCITSIQFALAADPAQAAGVASAHAIKPKDVMESTGAKPSTGGATTAAQGEGQPAPQASASSSNGAVSTGDVLALTRIVLDTSREHSQASAERLQMLVYIFGALGAIVAFVAGREWRNVVRPYKEKLDALEKSHSDRIAKHKEELEGLFAQQKEVLDKRREALIADFSVRLHRNAVALVAAPLMWEDMERAERAETAKNEAEVAKNEATAANNEADIAKHEAEASKHEADRITALKSVINRADRAIDGQVENLDGYLAAILLIRKAYALKRLGDVPSAFEATVTALEQVGSNAHDSWLYNAACYAALTGRVGECCDYLSKAISSRAEVCEDARTDGDFDAVRETEEFIAVISRA